MAVSLSEQLTSRFYEWEQRGRGRHVFDFSVELEPEFYPFFGHYFKAPELVDDSRRPTVLSSIVNLFSFKKKEVANNDDDIFVEIPPVTWLEERGV